jgi:hypothetical protein
MKNTFLTCLSLLVLIVLWVWLLIGSMIHTMPNNSEIE